ncbi:Oxysterol-binding protein-related protein 4C [Acorus calamus]|uniref:Oxysterol-binding protein-related protein 4C n=1 Tax=Acorus calamus TaxID=4465 RepID=A0AAV9CPE2_ACOCL|nr:Oxysterol-binding protein-related protein 4C [Acorus calamus]
MPKSQLQCYGETVYCVGVDMLGRCSKGRSSLERFMSVVAWSVSTNRPPIFGLAPYNPVLGETHHVTNGSLNVLLEQTSLNTGSVSGTCVEAVIHGKRLLKLSKFGETYEMNSPNLLIRILPIPGIDWTGNVKIRCENSGLEADLCYRGHSFLGFGGNHSVNGKIIQSKSSKVFYEIQGHWDKFVTMKDMHSGDVTVLYDAKEVISKLKTPILKDAKGVSESESVVVWGGVSLGILSKDWERAREEKRSVEERERRLARERKSRGMVWSPKHFSLAHTKDGGWDCWPVEDSVPPAPIAQLNLNIHQIIIISLPEMASSLSLVRVPLEPPNFHARPHNPTSNGHRFLHQKTNHRLSVSASVSATPPPVAVVDSAGGPSDLVRSILSKVEGTDRGVRLAEEGHREVDELANRLKKFCVDDPVKCPLIFGEWDVVYCSVPTSPGGGYRSAFGRLVFKTNEMVQGVEAPDTISNRVSFSVFGFLDGEVSLKGKLKVLDDKWIQVVFEPPHLKIGSLDFQYGGESEVKLEITYIDEKIRLGKGSRGSLFVFRRRG